MTLWGKEPFLQNTGEAVECENEQPSIWSQIA